MTTMLTSSVYRYLRQRAVAERAAAAALRHMRDNGLCIVSDEVVFDDPGKAPLLVPAEAVENSRATWGWIATGLRQNIGEGATWRHFNPGDSE